MVQRAESLGTKNLDVSAKGVYPESRKQTKVQAVAVYQNDGTATIKASRFVERAANAANDWKPEIEKAIIGHIDGEPAALDELGRQAARDINEVCDRIKTRRLKHSFRHVIKSK